MTVHFPPQPRAQDSTVRSLFFATQIFHVTDVPRSQIGLSHRRLYSARGRERRAWPQLPARPLVQARVQVRAEEPQQRRLQGEEVGEVEAAAAMMATQYLVHQRGQYNSQEARFPRRARALAHM